MNQKLPLAVTALLLAVLPFCLAATPAAKTAAKPTPNATPAITVTKNDGSTVRGKLTHVAPGSITVEAPGVGAEHPTIIAWRDIDSVSNGLTQAKALAQFKTEHHWDELCDTCHGLTTVSCATCKGTGHDPASSKECATCHGGLLVDCKAPKCKDGNVPCPGKCMKRNEGKWEMKDGVWSRMFSDRAWAHESHLGHIMTFVKGTLEDKGICLICSGNTTIPCPTCNGMAKVACPTCLARQEAPACPAHCEKGRETCKGCNGTGLGGGAVGAPPAPAPTPPQVEPKKPEPLPF